MCSCRCVFLSLLNDNRSGCTDHRNRLYWLHYNISNRYHIYFLVLILPKCTQCAANVANATILYFGLLASLNCGQHNSDPILHKRSYHKDQSAALQLFTFIVCQR